MYIIKNLLFIYGLYLVLVLVFEKVFLCSFGTCHGTHCVCRILLALHSWTSAWLCFPHNGIKDFCHTCPAVCIFFVKTINGKKEHDFEIEKWGLIEGFWRRMGKKTCNFFWNLKIKEMHLKIFLMFFSEFLTLYFDHMFLYQLLSDSQPLIYKWILYPTIL